MADALPTPPMAPGVRPATEQWTPPASDESAPHAGGAPGGLRGVLRQWRHSRRLAPHLALQATQPATDAQQVSIPPRLAGPIMSALVDRGITQLYSHQAQAFEQIHVHGRHCVVATPTASGKSLCYNLPVLQALSETPAARALYLFPTKALSRDQETNLREFMQDVGVDHGVITYDGDTPGDARRAARQRAGVVITNPDMLHAGILPHHANWARLFANLRYVVIDELHVYRGVFGSHLANVLRRLRRIAAFHGAHPRFVFASATIGNPAEHASAMLGDPVQLVGQSGAPTGERHVLVYNPPVVNQELGIRTSYVKEAVRLASDLLQAGVPTLVFGQSRNNVEVMLKYLRDRLAKVGMSPEMVQGYRGGYLPGLRRDIEKGLRAGRIRCVVATSALELGIDIGSLQAVVCAGYPGSLAGLWQRFGRGGRRGDASLALLVTSSAPLNQYFALQPELLLSAPVEQARIDPDNIEVLIQHLKCAAFELPFETGECFGEVPAASVEDAMQFLVQHRVVHPVSVPAANGAPGKTSYHWSTDTYPANHVSLRSASWDNVVIIDQDRDVTLAEMDWPSAHTMLHEQAIYQHTARQFQVERFDYENKKAYVREVVPDYYTDAMTHTRVAVIEQDAEATLQWKGARPAAVANSAHGGADASMETDADTSPVPQVATGLGEVSVVEKVVGYKKIKYHTHENIGYGDVRLPELQMHTTAAWFTLSQGAVQSLKLARPSIVDGWRGIGHALHLVGSVHLMVDPRDLGYTMGEQDPSTLYEPTLFLFDRFPGGIGLAARLHEDGQLLLERVRALLNTCACEYGCPGCVGPQLGDAAQIEQAATGTTDDHELEPEHEAADIAGQGGALIEAVAQVPRKRVAEAILRVLNVGPRYQH